MQNNLPKYWVVDTKDDTEFKLIVVNFINDDTNDNFSPTWRYFGYVGLENSYSGYDAYNNIDDFRNKFKLLTKKQFLKAIKEEWKPIPTLTKADLIELLRIGHKKYGQSIIFAEDTYEDDVYETALNEFMKKKNVC